MFWDVRGRRLFRASLFALFRRIDFFAGLFMGLSVLKELIDSLVFGGSGGAKIRVAAVKLNPVN